MDVTDFQQCRKLIMQEDPLILYHLVAQPIVTAAMRDPLLTIELTTRGTYNLLEAVRQVGKNIRAIVFVSSDKVYGENMNANESSPLNGTDHPYNAAKVAADVLAQSYAKAYKLPIVISRSANLYGPNDFHWDRIVPGVCRDIIYGRSTSIRSNGLQRRDYIHVSDGVRALRMMADAMENESIPSGSVFNFGGAQPHNSLEVVHRLTEIAGRIDLEPIVMDTAQDEITDQHIDYSKAMALLGWAPEIGLEDGLRDTYSWYRTWFQK
jgi:nucleoside-diphosphate-sugar epimerase